MSTNAASYKESNIKKPIVINSKQTAKIIVPACKSVRFPTLCRIQMAMIAPIITKPLRTHGITARKLKLACEIISPPYAATAFMPENCLKIIQCIAQNIANAGVEGSYISMPDSAPLLIEALLANLNVGAGIPESFLDNCLATSFALLNSIS